MDRDSHMVRLFDRGDAALLNLFKGYAEYYKSVNEDNIVDMLSKTPTTNKNLFQWVKVANICDKDNPAILTDETNF